MKNFVTGYEYTGQNEAILSACGVESVLTFKQAIKLKGLKKCATLIGYKTVETEEGKKEQKPFYFSVFNSKEVLARAAA